MNTIKAVLTGDIIQSRKLDNEGMDKVLECLHITFNEIQEKILKEEGHLEVYRGDSFQILINEAHLALKVAIILKSRLRSLFNTKTTTKGTTQVKSDARIAIGIGSVRMQNNKIIESQGEAFELSGIELDKMKNEALKLSIKTPWPAINDELKVNILFAENTINSWSAKTAESVFRYLLYDETQEMQAKHLQISQPAIQKRLNVQGNMKAIDAFIKRYEYIIKLHTKAQDNGL